MHIINAHFEKFTTAPVYSLLGSIGVYILWDRQAKARPTYIGEGNILKRLVEHTNRFAAPLHGYVAVLDTDPWQRAKADAEIVEALLLAVANNTDRAPSTNVAPGKLRRIEDIFAAHGILRVNVRGFDPFSHPATSRPLTSTKQIIVRPCEDGSLLCDHDWQWRRRMKTA